MIIYSKRAIKDILDHRFLSVSSIITIAVSVLIAGAVALFLMNANDIMNSWKKGIRVMAYLKTDIPEIKIGELKRRIEGMNGVRDVQFISKNEALKRLKGQMKRQPSLLENLKILSRMHLRSGLQNLFKTGAALKCWPDGSIRLPRWKTSSMDRYGSGAL